LSVNKLHTVLTLFMSNRPGF